MSQKFNYYGMVGSNGYGIVKLWKKCMYCSKYFKQIRTKGFYTSKDAYNWIIETFSSNYVFQGNYNFESLDELLEKQLVFIRKRDKERAGK